MATRDRYATPAKTERFSVGAQFDATFVCAYDDGSQSALEHYAEAKQKQWDGASRIDWSRDLEPENCLSGLSLPQHGSYLDCTVYVAT